MLNNLISPLAVAPMVSWTNTHFRNFMRYIAPKALLYTEMHPTWAIEHNACKILAYNIMEQPLALQLGGSSPMSLAQCAVLAERAGFTEINLNLGCPSPKVQAGKFGVCLMYEPRLVAQCIIA